MSHRRQTNAGPRLPKVLLDELVSLGKLDSKRSRGKPRFQQKRLKSDRNTRSSPPALSNRSPGKPLLKQNHQKSVRTGFEEFSTANGRKTTEEAKEMSEEDKQIAKLQKKLGLEKEKKSKKGGETHDELDMLDDLVDGLGTSHRGTKRKRTAEISYRSKKRDDSGVADESAVASDQTAGDSDESEFEGFGEDTEEVETDEASPQSVIPLGKYIPPAVRKAMMQESAPEQDPKLRKQVQGLLNRLSETNMTTMLSEIEQLYRAYPRANVTTTITDLLLTILSAKESLLDTFAILHAGFVAALYRIVGIDFVAQIVQTLVEKFDKVYPSQERAGVNLIVFLSELYNFGVIGSGLMYDLIKMFLDKLTEFDTELLLKIIQNSGPQLRKDDPSSLKEIVILMQSNISTRDPGTLTVRMKFMVDAIVDLKNNRTKALTSTSVVTSEATVRMKKLLGSLGGRNLRSGGERLGVTLEDIRNIEKKGKWWLPGASWKDDGLSLQLNNPGLSETDKLVIQARRRGMNTEVRVSIFVALMGSLDYIDAHRRISLLQLKKNQMQEIATVLVTCCLKENPQAPYNAFYSVVAKRLCSPSSSPQVARAVRRGLQFRLWGFFREWGENSDDGWEGNENDYDEAVDEDQKLIRTVKLAKLYGDLIVGGVLSLDVLKELGFVNLQQWTKTFVEILISEIVLKSQGKDPDARNAEPLLQYIHKLADIPALAKGLDWYIKKHHSRIVNLYSKEEEKKACVVWGIGILRKGIAEISEQD